MKQDEQPQEKRIPHSINESVDLLKELRAGLDMPLLTPEYQVLTYLIEAVLPQLGYRKLAKAYKHKQTKIKYGCNLNCEFAYTDESGKIACACMNISEAPDWCNIKPKHRLDRPGLLSKDDLWRCYGSCNYAQFTIAGEGELMLKGAKAQWEEDIKHYEG